MFHASIRLVQARINTLILAKLSLLNLRLWAQIDSDTYLRFNLKAFHNINEAIRYLTGTLNLVGGFITDDATQTSS